MTNVAILIPAYNAASSLPQLLQQTARFIPAKSIIVINDGSKDETEPVAKKLSVVVLSHKNNQGKGAALQTGFDYALQNNFDAVITMDADLQHQPVDIERFLRLYEAKHYDIIIGSRLQNTKGMPLHRILSNTITTFLIRARTGADISDSQSGFRFITKRVLENVRLTSNGFESETEFLIKAASCGHTFGSLPIETIYAGEKSHMTHIQTTLYFIKVLFKQY
ncbi:MAG: glycosyltransferase family 2 protein [Bacteroidota bacterium]|nr:glycosyltransferase family 2 protein [Bacteroidota bacterium]